MRKIVLMMVMFIGCAICSYGQIFNKVKVLDKFDDVVSERTVKTLVTYTDSTIVVEEKGKQPEEYTIICKDIYRCLGSRDDVVEVADGVYGFQMAYFTFKESDKDEEKCAYHIVDRYVSSSSFTYKFSAEIFWIQNTKGYRTIYYR